ncbi:MAG: DUF1343 domain-containing protein [Inquilinus sp.]|nr:DUF1343 domain-containing protein [Inquilinus sp.]
MTSRTPLAAGIDAVVCELPDVGCRAFTYLATLLSICRAAAEAEVAAVILDRPNPIGGIVEGGGVVAGQENFVAPYDLPLRHGLTLGEVARLFCAEQGLAPPAVVPCDGWQRTPIALGSVYVSPSPNMPTPTAALAYPGAVLLEGTGLSEGRGTVRPFTLLGAPGIDGDALARHLAVAELPGLRVRAARFRPAASKHAGALCGGVELYVDDPRAWRALPVVLEILAFIRDRHGASLEPGAFLDRLSGGTTLREWCLTSGADPRELIDPWTAEHDAHRDRVAPHLLYRAEP